MSTSMINMSWVNVTMIYCKFSFCSKSMMKSCFIITAIFFITCKVEGQQRCTQGLACYSSAQCGYGVCQTIPGSGKYVLIPKVWFFFWFQHRKQFITPYSYHHFLNKTKGTLVHECEQLTLLSTCSDYRLQGTSNLLIEAKS